MKSLILNLVLLSLLFACNQMKELYKEIKSYGYIPYSTPLEFAGPGTLVGGRPSQLSLISAPDSCFPREINGVPTDLYRIDNTTLPKKSYSVTAYGNVSFDLADFLSNGNPVLGAGVNFNVVKTMILEMRGVHIEYIDSIKLTEFYNNHMSEICKVYLDTVGFVIQAMKVDEMEVRFYNKNGVAIKLGLQNLESIVDLNLDVGYEVVNETSLIITTPKYIGYQLGQLRLSDQGYVLYRAASTKKDKFVFESLNVFEELATKGIKMKSNLNDFAGVKRKDYIEKNSIYLD